MTRTATLCCLTILLTACGTSGPERSGFLARDIDFRPHPERPGALRWLAPDIDLTGYDSLMIEPIAWQPIPGAPANPGEAPRQFYDTLVAYLEPYYELMDREGQDILRIRFALTDLVTASDTTPGRVGLEGELLDSRTNRRLGALVDVITLAPGESTISAFIQWSDRLLAFMDEHDAG